MVLLSASNLGYAQLESSSQYWDIESFDDKMMDENFEIIKVMPFNHTNPSSIIVDPTSNLVYVSVRPDYSYNNLSQSCFGQDTIISNNVSDTIHSCSVIYVLDGETDQIIDTIRLGPGEQIHDMDIEHRAGKIYATGQYNYLVNDSEGSGEQIQYEDDVVYIIGNINHTGKENTRSYSASDNNNTQKITFYGEIEEGKEGDMSDIAIHTNTNTIYAGIRYFQGGRAGLFIIPDANQVYSKPGGVDNKNNLSNAIKFIPFENTGPEQILVNDQMNSIYVLLEHDDSIAIIDGSTNEIREKIILQNPRAMSISPSTGLLYVASGDSFWFNIMNMSTNKVIAVNTQISYPIASVVNNITGRVFVAECLECDDFDFTNGTSIYELNNNGSTIAWNTYENINIEENGLAINPFTNKLYAIGTDTKSEVSNLYIIDIL
jgi:DNA-binding beta-propeller fold protein YncE